jgi:peptidoglycan/xylan/chitin deacetylase (PgdA/CDA1 family)
VSTAKIRLRQAAGDALFRIAGRPSAAPGTLTILVYHAVTATPMDDAGQMSVSAERFERQMDELAAAGVAVVDLAAGVQALGAAALAPAAAAVVFDDGFVGVHDQAADVLQRRGWPATVFITTAWIGAPAMPLAEPRLGRPLTWAEIDALRGAGFAIGSHTHTHARLARVSEASMRDELRESSRRIADRVGERPESFAYPFGAFDSFDGRTRQALAEEGFRAACTTIFGRNTPESDPLALKRVRVSWCDGDGEIAKLLAGCYDWYRWVQRAQTARR